MAIAPTIEYSSHTRPQIRDPMLPTPYRVIRTKRENHDTFTLELEHAAGPTEFHFLPGQFNMLYAHGVGEVPISISGDPDCTDRIIHTTRVVGAVTRAMQRMEPGDVIGVRGPMGTAWPMELAEGHDVVIVTGGIGLAPLRPCVYHILANRAKYNRFVMFYGARTPKDIVYSGELRKWGRQRGVEVQTTVDRAGEGWRGHVGVVTTLIPRASFTPSRTIALVCGPEIMIRFAVMALQSRGVDRRNIYVSMERNMKCGVGFCGHCQFGPEFVCRDGPVFPFDRIERLFAIREV